MKLNLKRLAISGGIIWGAVMFICTLAGVFFGYATDFLRVMGSLYPGYSISISGSIIGALYGFIDVYVGVYIFAWVYRKIK